MFSYKQKFSDKYKVLANLTKSQNYIMSLFDNIRRSSRIQLKVNKNRCFHTNKKKKEIITEIKTEIFKNDTVSNKNKGRDIHIKNNDNKNNDNKNEYEIQENSSEILDEVYVYLNDNKTKLIQSKDFNVQGSKKRKSSVIKYHEGLKNGNFIKL
jgi:hypothetical protein